MLPRIVHENAIKIAISQNHSPPPLRCAGNTRARSVRMSVVLEVSANIWDIRYQSGMDCMRGHDIMSTLDGGRGSCKNRGPHRFPHMNADRGGRINIPKLLRTSHVDGP